MTPEEMRHSIEAHDRQLDTVVSLLASLAERLNSLVHLAELQNARITKLEEQR